MMKKIKTHKILSLLLAVSCMLFLLSACSSDELFKSYDTYSLASITLDGENMDIPSVYPNGAALELAADGTGRIQLGDLACNITWQQTDSEIKVQINDLEASGTAEDGLITLTMGNTGLVYCFTVGAIAEEKNNSAESETELQQQWNGSWSGRLYFHDSQGEWEDYDGRSMKADAVVSIDSEGKGSIRISNSAYSEEMPMADIILTVYDNTNCRTESGFFMEYPLEPGGLSVSITKEDPDDIESTTVIHPEEYSWNIPALGIYPNEEPSELVDVLRVSGTCSDEDGSIEFMIVLQR